MVYVSPVDACSPVAPPPRHFENRTQWIALIRRSMCSFVQKVSISQHALFEVIIT